MKVSLWKRRAEIGRALIPFLLVALGTASIAFGTALFILPFELVTGGISGLSIVVSHLSPFAEVPIDVIVAFITWACFFIGWAAIGHSFAAKTFLSTLLYPPLLSAFIGLFSEESFGGYFHLPSYPYPEAALMLSSVFGGAFVGIGCALAFIGGGSTGGTDVFALIAADKSNKIKASGAVFLTDAIIIILGAIPEGNLIKTLFGILTALTTAFFIQKTLKFAS